MKSIDELRNELKVCGCDPDECVCCEVPRKVRKGLEEVEREIERDYMRLPRDRGGEVIRIGDEVWFHDDGTDAEPHVVRGYGMTNGRDVDVFASRKYEGWCPNTVTVPDVLVHRRPDPLKELLKRHEDECLAIRVEASDTQAKESVWRKALDDKHAEYAERIRELIGVGE